MSPGPGFTKRDASMLRTAWELSAGLLSFVVAIGMGWWFGRHLDAWVGTAPWLTAIFTVLGFAAGILNVYRTLTRAMGEERR
jgi:ATP synthase protein I